MSRSNYTNEIDEIRSEMRKIVRSLGIVDNIFSHIGSVSQCHALQRLESGPITLLELSQELSLDHSSVSRLAKQLVSKGLCDYRENTNDGRSRYLFLTEAGTNRAQEIHEVATRQVRMALNVLTESERRKVVEGIKLYSKALQASEKGTSPLCVV